MPRNTKKSYKKSSYKDTNRKPNARQEDKDYEEGRNDRRTGAGRRSTGKGDNDPMWYAASPQLLKDAASLAFSNMLGSPITFEGNNYLPSINDDPDPITNVPGIAILSWAPTVGLSTELSSPINLASKAEYSWVRHANSGSANYDSPDLTLYELAMAEAYSFVAEITRLYGIIRTYSFKNRYYAEHVVTALGYDYQSIHQNLANLRYMLNLYIRKIGSMAVPANKSYVLRHWWMNSQLFLDSASAKAQTYAYRQDAYYVYEEKEGPGKLKCKVWNTQTSEPHTYEEIIERFQEMIEPIVSSEDLNIMSGDILKAYQDSIFRLSLVDTEYQVVPVYSTEVLGQINNFRGLGELPPSQPEEYGDGFHSIADNDVTQKVDGPQAGAIINNPVVISINRCQSGSVLFNSMSDNPDPATVMVDSRMVAFGSADEVGSAGYNFVYKNIISGSEIPLFVTIYTLDYKGGLGQTIPILGTMVVASGEGGPDAPVNVVTAFDIATKLSAFDWAPMVDVSVQSGEFLSNGTQYVGTLGDFNNFTLLTKSTLNKMHETALLSEFYSPQMSVWGNK